MDNYQNSDAITCHSCNKTLPNKGFYCGFCLTQFRCKNCNELLIFNAKGCIECGSPVNSSKKEAEVNSFRMHETKTERTIEATFSNEVGKDLASILSDATRYKKIGSDVTVSELNKLTDNNGQNFTNGNTEYAIEVEESESKASEIPTSEKREHVTNNEYPSLKAVTMKNLPASEVEWVVVYAFYASNYGEAEFTRSDITAKYAETNRKTKESVRDLTTYITRTVRQGFLNPFGDQFSLLELGIEKAKEILNRKMGSPPKVKKSSKQTSNVTEEKQTGTARRGGKSNGKSNLKRINDLDLSPKGKESLASFYQKFQCKNYDEKHLIFVYYLSEVLDIQNITPEHIYTCYEYLDQPSPVQFTQSLRNTSSATGYIITSDKTNITLAPKGRNKVKTWTNELK
ncbi:zinc ribbon domain-containing protein [Chitinophaga deserti]|uniref:zinc ribbon domain-containing protein n=1 Tax=Chitinophaga deserti TaxID=2164099 RepID=UPI0013002D26|nr:zinc ribbon domain-containing protein [Chitinophaga deserti]